jgi:hypothetical protein
MLASKVLELVKEFVQEGPYSTLKMDDDHVLRIIERFQTEDDKFISCSDAGLLAAMLTRNPLTNELQANEIVWYVRPQYRGSKSSLKFLKDYEAWATAKGVKYLCLSLHENEYAEPLSKLYTRRGYTKMETTFIKELV